MSITSYNIIIGACAAIVGIIAFTDEFPKIKTLRFVKLYKVIVFIIATSIGIWASVKKDSIAEIENSNENAKNAYKIIDSIGRYVETSKRALTGELDTLNFLNNNIFKQEQELINQNTGGENAPTLDFSGFNQIFTYNENIHYCPLVFSILNNGKYPFHDVRIEITDIFGREMLKYRIMVLKGNFSTEGGPGNEEAYNSYDPVKIYDFGTISKKIKEPLYMTEVSPELCAKYNGMQPEYTVFIQWSNGCSRYFINCILNEKGISISNVQLILNDKKINYHKYFITNISEKP